MTLKDDSKKQQTKTKDAPIVPPKGSIPPIQTAKSLESAVMLSSVVIATMIGLYVLIALAWGWLTVRFLLALPERLANGFWLVDAWWLTLAAIIVIVLVFLIKPLLPLRRKQAPPIELAEADQPELFAYIRGLAKCIDAPEPERVLVDVHPNASASFAGGMSPTSGPLTLTLGLPLVGGMSVRQVAGVVAHELGHFSQGSMIKQNIVIGFVSGWLTEVALGEDLFDNLINRLAFHAPPIIRHFFKLVRLITNAIRRVFYVVMVVGHLVTRMVARQLEYDADQFMAHTTGSAHFAETMRETIILGHAGIHAIQDAERFYRDRRLPNNLPAMVVTKARRMDDKQRKKILSGEDQDQAEAFSTHPLTKKRIEKAAALDSKGLVHDDRPARGLFRNFDQLCKDASESLYKEVIGKDYDPKHLTDSTRLIAELEATDKARKAALRFCQSELLMMLPMFPSYRGLRALNSQAMAQMALEEIRELRERAQGMRAKAYPLMRKFDEAQDKLMQTRQAHATTHAGFQIRDFAKFGLEAGHAAGLNRSVSEQVKQVEEMENQVTEYNADLIKRMELNFALLKHPKVTERLGQAKADKIWNEIDALVPAGRALASAQESYDNLRVNANILGMGMHLIVQGVVSQGLIMKITQTAKDTAGDIKDILRALGMEKYPFAHGDGKVSMAEAVCEKPADEDSISDIFFVAEDVVGRFAEMRERIIGRLCHHAERVEKVMGMKPLPAPDEADGLEDLLEKIGVDDAPVQEEPASAAGLVGMLLTQGVMGVVVLGLAGLGVYALLPSEPNAFADDERPAQVAQNDERDRGSTPTRPDRNPSIHDRPRPDRPDRFTPPTRPDRSTPEKQPSDWTADEALQRLAGPFQTDQAAGMRALRDNEYTLSTQQQARFVASIGEMLNRGIRSADLSLAIDLLETYTDDDGLSALSAHVKERSFFVDRQVIQHLGKIDKPEAADLLALLAKHLSHRREVTRLFGAPPMDQYAEDALLGQLTGSNGAGLSMNEKRSLVQALGEVATQKSSDFITSLLDDSDGVVRRDAEEIIERIDPQVNDAAVRFLRSVKGADSRASLWRELRDLAESPPEEGDERRASVSQALVAYAKGGNRRIDHSLLGALAAWGDKSAVPLYLELLEDERASRAYVKTAITAAGQQASEAQTENVAKAIGNWFLLETDAVTDALIALGPAGEGPAIEHLKSKHAKVRLGCIQVLSEVGTIDGLKALQGMGSDPDREVRDIARDAYYQLRDKIKKQNEAKPRGE